MVRILNVMWKPLLLLVIVAAAGCAASRQAVGGTMEDIGNLESSIEEQRGIIAGGSECHERCRAAESICDSAGRICDVASELAEVEALQSCRRAESVCHEARRQVEEECACE